MNTVTPAEKIERFRALHTGPGVWVMPNPWDAGSARMLAGMGFQALATSSSAAAGTAGRKDYRLSRDEVLAMAKRIVDATDLPVSADLENGFGDSPEAVAETVRMAGEIGLAGCSIEDAPGNGEPYDLGLATERVAAAVDAARAMSTPLVLTARAERTVESAADLADTITRLQAYEAAGADVLFAPGVRTLAQTRTVVSAVSRPLSVMAIMEGGRWGVRDWEDAGVKRISLAAALYRTAMTALHTAALEIQRDGTFGFCGRGLSGEAFASMMRD